jgi:hypothetical protein
LIVKKLNANCLGNHLTNVFPLHLPKRDNVLRTYLQNNIILSLYILFTRVHYFQLASGQPAIPIAATAPAIPIAADLQPQIPIAGALQPGIPIAATVEPAVSVTSQV